MRVYQFRHVGQKKRDYRGSGEKVKLMAYAQGTVLAESRVDEGLQRVSLKGQAGLLISLIVE